MCDLIPLTERLQEPRDLTEVPLVAKAMAVVLKTLAKAFLLHAFLVVAFRERSYITLAGRCQELN